MSLLVLIGSFKQRAAARRYSKMTSFPWTRRDDWTAQRGDEREKTMTSPSSRFGRLQ